MQIKITLELKYDETNKLIDESISHCHECISKDEVVSNITHNLRNTVEENNFKYLEDADITFIDINIDKENIDDFLFSKGEDSE